MLLRHGISVPDVDNIRGNNSLNLVNMNIVGNDYSKCEAGVVTRYTGFTNMITYSRASTGTAEKLDGTVVSFGNNIPRITDRGYLSEDAATNLCLYSQDINNATWVLSVATKSAGPTSPELSSASTIVQADTDTGGVYQLITVAASTTYTASWWAKSDATSTDASYRIYDNIGLTNIIAQTSYFSSINQSTWTRISVTFTTPVGCVAVRIYPLSGRTAVTNSGRAAIWGVQLEQTSYMTSYIPTTATSATRVADDNLFILSTPVAGPNLTCYVDVDIPVIAGLDRRFLYLFRSAASNADRVLLYRSTTNNATRLVTSSSISQHNISLTGYSTITRIKIAISITASLISSTTNGSAVQTSVPSAFPVSMNYLRIGSNSSIGPLAAFGYIRNVQIYERAETGPTLIAMTV